MDHNYRSPRTGPTRRWVMLGLAALTFAGCGGAGTKLIQATGSITVDGKPAEGAVLLFHPEDNEIGSVSTAVAAPDGKFSIVTNAEPGLPAGSYKVTITWPDPAVKPPEGGAVFGKGFGDGWEPGPDLLKGRYVAKERSGLSVTIDAATKELPAFALNSK
jgi:hypothetical protein